MAKKQHQRFDFVKEVYERGVSIDIIRELELETLIATIAQDLENDDTQFLHDILWNNGNDYFQLRDDLFLERMIYNYSDDEEILTIILETAEKEMYDQLVSKKLVIDGKEYKIKNNNNNQEIN
jgi:hypothetical protein